VDAIVGPGAQWSFGERLVPLWPAELRPAQWTVTRLRAILECDGALNEISQTVLGALPSRFSATDLDGALAALPAELLSRPGSVGRTAMLREIVSASYRAIFSGESRLSQRVLQPVVSQERGGMEDARFVRFVNADRTVDYRGTYSAYDGRTVVPRLIITTDFRAFEICVLSGSAAAGKGLTLFPRLVGGRRLALCRVDGESIALAESADGFVWDHREQVHEPSESWEIVQTGNCGPPIETERGWLVLTHGVGPMRTYSLGAILLDLDDPARVIARTALPLVRPGDATRDGYVPNVVYSCGGVIHDGVLWIPLGIGDNRITMFSVLLQELFSLMSPVVA